jgi:hypothetical protein
MINMLDLSIKTTRRSFKMEYKKDEYGKDILLKDNKYQVMMEWEKSYMERCIDLLKPSGDVLEVGFGMGYSATRIQQHNPQNHTIIECDPEVLVKAKEWAVSGGDINIIEGVWQEKIKGLPVFDSIFFDDFFPFDEGEVAQIKGNISVLGKREQVTNELLEACYETFQGVKFADSDLASFQQYLCTCIDHTPDNVVNFIDNLRKYSSITEKQYQNLVEGLNIEEKQIDKKDFSLDGDRLVEFVEECFANHMKTGSRISFYVNFREFQKKRVLFKNYFSSKYDLKYTEEVIDIDVPENCEYYAGDKAMIVVMERK